MRPIEWLLDVTSTSSGFVRLLEESGGLAVAAHQLAKARCMTRGLSTDVPTRLEVLAAARQLAAHAGINDVPRSHQLASECEAAGLLVI